MKIKTLKKKSCYTVMVFTLSSFLFLTGLTGCKDREAEFLMEGIQETKAETELSDEKTSDKKNSDVTDGQENDRSSQKAGSENSGSSDNSATDNMDANVSAEKNSSNGNISDEETATASNTELPEMIYVDVCGAVVNPGVFELASGSRVFQAIEAAGGYLPEAVQNCVNRASVLTDGQQLYILTQEEMEKQGLNLAELANASDTSAGGTAGNIGAGVSADAASSGQQDNKININTADETRLTALTGIGATRAQAIIAYREENGPFASIEDIMNVQGIKEGTFAKIKDEIVVE